MFDECIAMALSPVFRRNGHACQLITLVAFLEQCADTDNVRITREAENISPVGNDRFRMFGKFSIGRFQGEVKFDAHGGNWENSELAELAGAFAGIVEVSDHGPGITAHDLPRLFDRFYRSVSGAGHPRGTGIGLTLVGNAKGYRSVIVMPESANAFIPASGLTSAAVIVLRRNLRSSSR